MGCTHPALATSDHPPTGQNHCAEDLGYVVFELVLERWAELCVRPFKAPAKSAYA